MKVAVIGPGRVGTLVAVTAVRAGHRVVAVAGGSETSRRRFTGLAAGVRPLDSVADAARVAELVLLAVPDDAIKTVATELVRADAVGAQRFVHFSGVHSHQVLSSLAAAGGHIAACHPAMTVPEGAHDPELLHGTAWAITAPAAERDWVHDLVADLGGDGFDVPADRRALYHAGLSLGSNAVAAATAAARQLLLAANVDDPARFLTPLAHASVDNIAARGASAITGPIARGDVGTIGTHLETIADDLPALTDPYMHLSTAILDVVRAGLDPDDAAALAQALSVQHER